MKKILLFILIAINANATNSLPEITPVDYIFNVAVDWEEVFENVSADKPERNELSEVMQCDDFFATEMEVRSLGRLGKNLSYEIEGDCSAIGAFSDSFESWIRFSGPSDGCKIIIKLKPTEDDDLGDEELKMTYDLSDAC